MNVSRVAVFGGTGFLGRRIVGRLLERPGLEVRAVSRHPERVVAPEGARGRLEAVRADVLDAESIAAAVDGVQAVMNAVGLYVEKGDLTFRAIHRDGAGRVAELSRQHGVQRLVHVSGIGADSQSSSDYVRARGQGEEAVREAFEDATIFRPSVMFGPDDALLNTLVSLVRRLPAIPMFGSGRTRLQPAYGGDVAEAAAEALAGPERPRSLYELGGPEVFSYRDLLSLVMGVAGHRRLLVPVPFFLWDAIAAAGGILPGTPPLTEGQVALMKRDNVAATEAPGLGDLNVQPTDVGTVLEGMVRSVRAKENRTP